MATFTIEVRDSDGNDCTVYDYVVQAETADAARDAVWASVREDYPDDEEDGCDGTYHPCDCICEHTIPGGTTRFERNVCEDCDDNWECSHGGLLIGEPEPGDTSSRYHIRVELDTADETAR